MPLFFILSCITFKYSIDSEQFLRKTERAFKHLVIPAFVMFCIRIGILCLQNYSLLFDFNYLKLFVKERILVAIFSSGVSVQIFSDSIPAIGIPWFLIALFLGRTFFDYLNLKYGKWKTIRLCMIFSIIGVILGKIQWLPLSFDIVLAILPFFIVGKEYDVFKVENKPFKKMYLCFLIWALLLLISYILTHTYLELACRRYTLYPLCYITAIMGTVMISEFSVLACKLKRISKPFLYLGKNSLYMLCIHILDFSLFYKLWSITNNNYINMLLRVTVDSIIFVILMSVIGFIKKIKKI